MSVEQALIYTDVPGDQLPRGRIVDFPWTAEEAEDFDRYCIAAQVVDPVERLESEEEYKLSKHFGGQLVILQRLPEGGHSLLAATGIDEECFAELLHQIDSSPSRDMIVRNVIPDTD